MKLLFVHTRDGVTWKQRVRAVLGKHDWPYGASGDSKEADETKVRLIEWAEAYKFKLAQGSSCLHWLENGRCSEQVCPEGRHQWLDHVTGWTDANGDRLLLCQPYAQGSSSMADLLDTVMHFNIAFIVSGVGWYGNGTFSILLCNGEESKRKSRDRT